MLLYELIKNKRDGKILEDPEIKAVIDGYVAGTIPDYQIAALLMAIYFRGMETDELASWTEAMVHSGDVIEFGGAGPYVDKHSTGGVGDKISLPLAAVAACLGLHIPMISGRGLGHTGGTLDKLESIPGFNTRLSESEFMRIVDEVGCCIIGQTAALAPADKKLYALRDVTATVDSIPLIASSILSKKRASGISGLLMDVKTGTGAFMTELEGARALARTLVDLGRALGLSVSAFITDMNQPLGTRSGNSLEVIESIEILRGEGPEDSTELVKEFAVEMAVMCGRLKEEEARPRVDEVIAAGEGLSKFAQMVEAQGGNPEIVHDTSLLPVAEKTHVFAASSPGWLGAVDCEKVGQAIVALGGGRRRIDDLVDPSVGLVTHARIGDEVAAGQPLVTLHYTNEKLLSEALGLLERGIAISDEPAEAMELVKERL